MTKKIVTLLVLCLMLFSLLAMAFNVQPVSARDPGYIPVGSNVTVSFGVVTLVFDNVVASGYLRATMTSSYPPPPSEDGPELSVGTATASVASADPGFFLGVWDVTVTAKFTGNVEIGINYGALGGTPFQMWQTDPGDVNFDGKVNLADLVIIAKALGSTPSSPRWNPNCDLNGDGKVNLQDSLMALRNFGNTASPTWTDITDYVTYTPQIIWGTTDHFSLFGVR